jgi:hypothetical protein
MLLGCCASPWVVQRMPAEIAEATISCRGFVSFGAAANALQTNPAIRAGTSLHQDREKGVGNRASRTVRDGAASVVTWGTEPALLEGSDHHRRQPEPPKLSSQPWPSSRRSGSRPPT